MTEEYSPLIIDSTFLSDSKKFIKERIMPWEGLARSGIITEDDANNIKLLEKQSVENRNSTVKAQVDLYASSLLHVLSKINDKDDIIKNILALINDLLLDLPEFSKSLLNLSSADSGLPFNPFLKHLENKDLLIKSLSLYNLTILLKQKNHADNEVLYKIFNTITSMFESDNNYIMIIVQILQDLLIKYKSVYQDYLVSYFKPINNLITQSASHPNATGLQLSYNILLATWILSFNSQNNKILTHNFPQLAGNLLIIAKDSIKLKIVRISVAILKNFVSTVNSQQEQFKVIKLLLFHDALNTIKTLKERKFASNGSDEELANDLNYLNDNLLEIVNTKLTSFDEYMTSLENPKLISWASPIHKSNEFWLENSYRFKDSNFKLVKKIFDIMNHNDGAIPIILLNDLQFLIKNLGQDLITFVNNHSQYKLLVMSYLDQGNNELKYEALKTIQLLVGHNF
ncbi:unnamed protein product [Candida verbasci]|uniref:V-type proton ATPase subunit H n=1 Tax=Candida verbasci TaxID=1227364 RepID=A0A9W4TPP2_9ASCO|nr:unnamed protein product [Candida verbasci]